ncbi:MAG: amidohydrolase family protein [Gammaproteobacteria bacterium]|nr:amidohydrolase family protein [Gammaproteobacteria bacterium]
MSYASAAAPSVPTILDADSHLMELPDFLSRHVERSMRDRIPTLNEIRLADVGEQMRSYRNAREHAPDTVAELVALGDRITRGPKWHDALGAFNGRERGLALDLLGFERQVVFSSFCATKIFTHPDPAVSRATAAAHNRAMAEFCDGDSRLIGIAIAPLDEPQSAVALIDEALGLKLGAVWIPSRAPGGRSPGHPLHDPIWRRLAQTGTPFILHVGSSSLSVPDEWMNDGHPDRRSARGGVEVIGSKDLTVIFHSAQRFISALVLDGVLEKFPTLKGGVIELGAGWVPDTIRRLDHAVDIWARAEPHLGEFRRKPSEQFREQLRFTPYPFEDVGTLIRESMPELYLFSSDYPHAEGGRDPIGRFSRTLSGIGEADQARFFAGNFRNLFGAGNGIAA